MAFVSKDFGDVDFGVADSSAARAFLLSSLLALKRIFDETVEVC